MSSTPILRAHEEKRMRHKLVSHPSRVAFTKAMEETFWDWFGACMPGANSGQRLVPRTLKMCEAFPPFTWLLPPTPCARPSRAGGAVHLHDVVLWPYCSSEHMGRGTWNFVAMESHRLSRHPGVVYKLHVSGRRVSLLVESNKSCWHE